MEREDVLYVVDELERSLHSKLPERFLQLFMQLHDEHHMQLLFTTHYMKKGTNRTFVPFFAHFYIHSENVCYNNE